jgi:uncharacterized protein with von Willebrand factor type A (vWA) domain
MPDEPPGRRIVRRLTAFAATLRLNGFVVGLREIGDAATALAALDLGRPDRVRAALKPILCCRREDWRRFDELFDAHWRGRGVRRAGSVTGEPPPSVAARGLQRLMERQAAKPTARPSRVEVGAGDGAEPGRAARGGASAAESLAVRDLRHVVDPDDVAQLQALAERLSRRMRYRLARRQRQARRGRALDLRRTIRHSLERGGLPLELFRKQRRAKPIRLVLLLDASGSMETYTAFFLRFARALLAEFRHAEGFAFHTRLVHLSPVLRDRDAVRAGERLSLLAQGWAGGTRIGECLAVFNRTHAAGLVTGRTAVLIVSDGYDTGEPERLGAEMARLRRRTRRIAWLNPMAGWRGYAPEAAGMRAALPHLDLFAPANSLASLARLEPYLARL